MYDNKVCTSPIIFISKEKEVVLACDNAAFNLGIRSGMSIQIIGYYCKNPVLIDYKVGQLDSLTSDAGPNRRTDASNLS